MKRLKAKSPKNTKAALKKQLRLIFVMDMGLSITTFISVTLKYSLTLRIFALLMMTLLDIPLLDGSTSKVQLQFSDR